MSNTGKQTVFAQGAIALWSYGRVMPLLAAEVPI